MRKTNDKTNSVRNEDAPNTVTITNTGTLSGAKLYINDQIDNDPLPKSVENTRTSVLNEASTLINGDREKDYGTPSENFNRIKDYWNIRLKAKLSEELTAQEIADLMVLLKMARAHNSPKRDTYVDMAGYSALSAELGDESSGK